MVHFADSIHYMAQLTLHDVDAELVERLERRAASHGVSTEEELRSIVQKALGVRAVPNDPHDPRYERLRQVLINGPEIPTEYEHFFDRVEDYGRDIDLE